ncbi:MAG: hypothetical protein J1F39_03205 [Clostridiales bacterium]|nr:hypothetical protein [Clostridiales bacterium]
MFRLVKVKENSLVLIYKYKKDELVYFGAARTDKPRRVPVLWGYTYAVFDGAPISVGTTATVSFSDGEGDFDYAATVEVSEWVAENAIKNLIGKSRDECVETAREKIARAISEVVGGATKAEVIKNKSENAFKIINAANRLLGEAGMIALAFRINAVKQKE